MRHLRRIIGLTLVLALAVCSFASCNKKQEKLTSAADEYLGANAYSVDVRVKYTSEDEAMATAISKISGTTAKISVDGDKLSAIMYLKNGDTQNYAQFTFIDGTLYTEFSEGGKVSESTKTYTDEDKAALREALGAGATISYDDFEEVEVDTVKKVSVISCENIKSEAIDALTAPLKAQLETVFESAEVSVYTVTLDIEIEDGRYNVIILNCEYFITTPTNSYTINMEYSMKFDYVSAVEITAPSFA